MQLMGEKKQRRGFAREGPTKMHKHSLSARKKRDLDFFVLDLPASWKMFFFVKKMVWENNIILNLAHIPGHFEHPLGHSLMGFGPFICHVLAHNKPWPNGPQFKRQHTIDPPLQYVPCIGWSRRRASDAKLRADNNTNAIQWSSDNKTEQLQS